MIDLQGVFVPITTPFDPVTGDVDLVALRRNVRAYLEVPIQGLVLFGSTGEGVLLEAEERDRALAAVRAITPDGTPLIAAIRSESTRGAIRQAEAAAAGGAEAVLVAPPAYYRPQLVPEALRRHFEAVADRSPLPVVLYQVPPSYTAAELAGGLVAELARHPNVVGIKDSAGDLRALGQLTSLANGGFRVLVGNGPLIYAGLEMGAAGCVVAVSALVPQRAARLYERWTAEDPVGAGRAQERLTMVHRGVVAAHGIPGIKAALEMVGYAGGDPRLPLLPLRAADRARVRELLERARALVAPE